MPDRYVQGLSRFAAALVAAGVVLKLLVFSLPAGAQAPVAEKLSSPITVQAVAALGNTALLSLIAIGLALPFALLVGVPAGLKPGSRRDRLLRAPAAVLSGVPSFVLVLLFLGLLSLRAKWLPMDASLYVALVLGVWPWLTLAVRDGLAGAHTPEGETDWGRAVPAMLGHVLSHTGSLLLAVMVPGLFFVPPGGLLTLLESSARQGDHLVAYGVLAICVPPVLLAHLAGDLLLAGKREQQRVTPSRAWLTAGLLMALVLAAATLVPATVVPLKMANLLPPGPGHWLGMDAGGRDLLRQFGAAARHSMAVGSSAAGVAVLGGMVLAIAARFAGDSAASVLTPRVSLPSLMTPFVAGIASTMLLGRNTVSLTVTLGVVAIPAMAYRLRLLLTAANRDGRRHALPGAAGALALVLLQSLLTEVTLGTLGIGLPATTVSLGTLTRDGLRLATAPHLVLPALLAAVGMAGLALVGHALLEAAGEPPSAQPAEVDLPAEDDLAAL